MRKQYKTEVFRGLYKIFSCIWKESTTYPIYKLLSLLHQQHGSTLFQLLLFFVSTTPNFEGRIVQPAGLQTSTPIILVFKSGHNKELRCTFAYASNFEGKFRFFYVFTAMLSKLASLNVKECHFLIFKQKSIDFSVLDNVILSKLNNWCKEMRKARPWHLTGLRVYYEIQASNTKSIPF